MEKEENKKEKLNRMRKDALSAEDKKQYFEAAILYKNLLGEARKQNNSKLIKEAKDKMIEMNKLSKDEFKEISIEQQIPTEMIEKSIKKILGESGVIEEVLKRIGQHPYLYPKKKEVEIASKKNISVVRLMASTHIVSNNNHSLGGNNQTQAWYLENYGIQQDFITRLYIPRIFYELKDKYGFNFDLLKSYLEKSKVFLPEDLFFIEAGLKNFFENDYDAAIHILVPRFEKCFIELSKALGIDTVSLKRPQKGSSDIITADITLSAELLHKDEFVNVWGDDFCENIIYVFYERLGYGLRHKIAHGTLSIAESNQLTCEIVIYFFLVLAARISIKYVNKE